MSTDSPSQEPNLPKKPTASKNMPNEATELDLWDLDSTDDDTDTDTPEKSEQPAKDQTSLPSRRIKESPIQSRKPTERQISTPSPSEEPSVTAKKSEAPPATRKPVAKKTAKSVSKKAAATDENKEDVSKPATGKEQDEEPKTESPDETSSTVSSLPSIPTLIKSLSKAEKIGTTALIVILALGALLSLIHFSNRVPTRSVISEHLDLPIEGKLIKVTEVETFWREPITTGDNPDTVKRGTKLIPVLKIKLESKSAAVRVLFRNEDGEVIGDPINRNVKGKTELTIPSTAGFDDIGMHAAYRTGESPPWIVQVLETTDGRDSIDKFDNLLETEISTDIR